jgi:hypothetical protein
MKESIGFKVKKVMDSYCHDGSDDYVFTLIFDSSYLSDFHRS